MALCGFRADNYRFGLLEGEGLARALSLLERVAEGLPAAAPAPQEDGPLLERLLEAGLLARREGGLCLARRGAELLDTVRALHAPRPPSPP